MVCAGDRPAAVEAYKKVEEKAAGSGLKMDNVFNMIRCTSTRFNREAVIRSIRVITLNCIPSFGLLVKLAESP